MAARAKTVENSSNAHVSENATMPGLLLLRAKEQPDAIALREKRFGIWHNVTWLEFARDVARTVAILEERAVRAGEYVAVFSENRYEWLYAELAIQSLGAISLGIHPATYEEELAGILKTGSVRILFCGAQEQVDRVREAQSANSEALLPNDATVFVFDPRGTRLYDDAYLKFWPDVLAQSSSAGGADAGREANTMISDLETTIAKLKPEQLCTVSFTSGRVDLPRGILFSHRALLTTAGQLAERLALTPRDRNLSYLPMCHYIEKMFGLILPLSHGITPHIAESDATVMEDLREVSPTVFVSWPKFWNRFRLGVMYRMSQASLVREFFFDWFLDYRLDRIKLRPGEKRGLWFKFVSLLGDLLFFRALQNKIGLRDCRVALATGDEIKESVVQWYLAVGVPLIDYYASSETGGAGFVNEPGTEFTGAQGRALGEQMRYRFARDRELMLQGPGIGERYFDSGEPVMAGEGWFYTGDKGFEDAKDRLRVTASKRFVVSNADGEAFSLKRTEEILRECPYIREAVCVGRDRAYVTALIELDFERTSDEIRVENLRFKRYEDLTADVSEVRELLQREIEKLNEDLIEVEKVLDFRFFPHELREEDGELSFDDSPRRELIARRYASLIQEMYSA